MFIINIELPITEASKIFIEYHMTDYMYTIGCCQVLYLHKNAN